MTREPQKSAQAGVSVTFCYENTDARALVRSAAVSSYS